MRGGECPVVIIGAGPAGLALGRQLQQREIPFEILEREEIGNSWRNMPRQLKLVSPWKWNYLASPSRFAANAQLTRAEFEQYLKEFAAESQLPVRSRCNVDAVRQNEDGFIISSSCGEIRAAMIVNATGYFSNPVTPQIQGATSSAIPQIHFAQFTEARDIVARFGAGANVLVVGKRLSAGQLALELFDAGLKVAISHRSPIQFGVDDWLWPFVYRTFAHVEAVRLCFGPGRPLDVKMPGGRVRKLVQSGAIRCYPAIRKFSEREVLFDDGATLAPQLVIFATGFAPALKFLAPLSLAVCAETGVPLTHGMESVSVPNLFFLGFEMLRNFQSRFLRGIRKDAVELAEIIAARTDHVSRLQRSASSRCVA